jgi:electron transport complex protein RnfD
MEELRFFQTPAPHLKSPVTVPKIMFMVVVALIPATVWGIGFFGPKLTLPPLIICILSCLFFEWLDCKIFKKPVTIKDGSALVTGLLLGLSLPPGSPFWIAIAGGGIAIILGKQMFGGLGQNIFNPALVGRAVLLISWPKLMTSWYAKTPFAFPSIEQGLVAMPQGVDVVTTPTALTLTKEYGFQVLSQFEPRLLWRLFIGAVPGSIGETSVLLLLIGYFLLLGLGIVKWDVPLFFLIGLSCVALITGQNPIYHLFAGGTIIGACFMANDYTTSPLSFKSRLIFGFGAGAITGIIRILGGYPEGVTFGILVMNAVVPLLDRILPRRFGVKSS